MAQLGWGIVLGAVYFVFRRDTRGAAVAGACVPTHWLLDYIVHRPDMPLVPGGTRYGLGMWNCLPLTLAAELGLFGIGLLMYLSERRAADRTGAFALWSLVVFLVAVYFASIFALGRLGRRPPYAARGPSDHLAIGRSIPMCVERCANTRAPRSAEESSRRCNSSGVYADRTESRNSFRITPE